VSTREVDRDEAIAMLRAGGLVALPTETVYGLAARADDASAVDAIFEAKGRPRAHPLIVHLASPSEASAWAAELPPSARRLADVLWPGPLTLVLKRAASVLDAVTGGRETVALRVPRHPLALEVIASVGVGLAAPSANVFGHVSPTSAAHVRAEPFARDVAVLDGGPCEVGLESTIVDVSEGAPVLLRPGGVAVEIVEAILGAPMADGRGGEARAPGMLAAHYAPRARVIAVRDAAEASARRAQLDGHVAFVGARPIDGARFVVASDDLVTRARELYATLRALDADGTDVILVELPDEHGLGLAIADRVRRAAHRDR
jgi:L-threonylcarbamoyladenylate synthase